MRTEASSFDIFILCFLRISIPHMKNIAEYCMLYAIQCKAMVMATILFGIHLCIFMYLCTNVLFFRAALLFFLLFLENGWITANFIPGITQ